jgi:tetraacyldisaccharide 4'-kinase
VGIDSTSARVGDEACMLARRLPKAVVVSGPDRLASAMLARRVSAQVAILDDGLQQRQIASGRKIWVLSAQTPFGNGHFLPLGPLRDAASAIAPDDVVWVHGEGRPPADFRVDVRSRSRPIGAVPASNLAEHPKSLETMRLAAFCGIARPHRFIAALREAGAAVVQTWVRGDHRVFSSAEILRAARIALARGASALICTEKDAVRLPSDVPAVPILALRVELEIAEGAEVIDRLFDGVDDSG